MSEIKEFTAILAEVRLDSAEVLKQIEMKAATPAAMKEFQAEMARLRLSVQSVNPGAVVNAAERGAKTAAGEIGAATTAFHEAVARIEASASGWKLKTALAAALVLLGVSGGIVLGVRAFPSALMATEPGCKIAGGNYSSFQQNRTYPTCSFGNH